MADLASDVPQEGSPIKNGSDLKITEEYDQVRQDKKGEESEELQKQIETQTPVEVGDKDEVKKDEEEKVKKEEVKEESASTKESKQGEEEIKKTMQDDEIRDTQVESTQDTVPAETDTETEALQDTQAVGTDAKTETAEDAEAGETDKLTKKEAEKEEPMEVDKDQLPAHRFTQEWSKLSREDLIDRIKGMVFGQAIGDALGLATEFMTKREAGLYYKKGLSYDAIVQDFHRSRWDKSDWTDDTDQMLLILLMIVERNGGVDQLDFAKRLYNWMRHGFPEFGDRGGMGIGATVSNTLRHHKFLRDPAAAAKEVWESSGRYLAANGAIMRTSILGALSFNDISKVAQNTVAIAEVTHADPRCKASCVATTVAIALMLQGKYSLDKKGVKAITRVAVEEASKQFEEVSVSQRDEMAKHIESSLKNLKLDDRNSIGYTFKALGCGFYGLREGGSKDFKKIITSVIMEAGDADSNAAVCGAVLGCKVGYKNLPEDLLQMKHKEWLMQKVDAFLRVTGLID